APLDQAGPDIAEPDGWTPVDPCTMASAVAVHASGPITLDGYGDEWSGACFLEVKTPQDWGDLGANHPSDFSSFAARFAIQWQPDALVFWVEVTDDMNWNDKSGSSIYDGDCLQVALDYGCSGGSEYTDGDFEFGWALTTGGQRTYRWYPGSESPPLGYLVRRDDGAQKTYYEVKLTSSDLNGRAFSETTDLCISVLVNEADGGDRLGWLHWASGVAESGKQPGLFLPVLLAP
ncbi:MAG: hypothetical protein JXR83_11535, partial [Deltaproteobacteria bacterium]|nr:hypothetical protein [Deltaproteobacteria bacterium]